MDQISLNRRFLRRSALPCSGDQLPTLRQPPVGVVEERISLDLSDACEALVVQEVNPNSTKQMGSGSPDSAFTELTSGLSLLFDLDSSLQQIANRIRSQRLLTALVQLLLERQEQVLCLP